jgi:hypothetical protein
MPELDFETEFEQVDPVELESVKRLIQLLNNSLKSLLIYPSNNPLPKEFKRKLYQSLSEFLDANDELNLEVGPHQLMYERQAVYEDGEKEEGLAYVLHRDGVRELAFLKGLDLDEIDDMLDVLVTCSICADLEEDLVTMLWEKDLNHVKYLVVDDLLDVDVPSAEDVPDDWDFDRHFHSEIAFADQDSASPAGDQPDLAREYREEQKIKLLKKLKEFSPEEVGSIQHLVDANTRYRSLDRFLDVLLEVLFAEEDITEFDQTMQTMEKVLATLINIADFHSAAKLVKRLKGFEEMVQKSSEEKDPLGKTKAERTRKLVDKAGDDENIQRMTQVLNDKEITDFSSAKEYLFSLNWNSISSIIHMFRDLKEFLARQMVRGVLTEKARNHLELLGEGVRDTRWYVVRNVVSVIGAIGSGEGVRLLRQVAKHRDLRVRKEVVNSLIRIPTPEAGKFLVSYLRDEDDRIRIQASRGLTQRKEKQALATLEEILKDDQFRDESPEEKKSMLESFAAIAGQEAVPILVNMVRKRSWLNRDQHNETRIFAIGALGLIDSPQAEDVLTQLSKGRNKAIRQACHSALRRIETRRLREGQSARIS